MSKLVLSYDKGLLVKNLRKIVKTYDSAIDDLFWDLCNDLKIDPEGEDGETLWDHIYNGTNWTVEFSPPPNKTKNKNKEKSK